MLSSALIGFFTVRLISVAHRKETQGKYIFQYFLSQLYRRVIILYIKCGHQGAAINMRGIETAFECTIAFYFHFRDLRSYVLCVNYSGSTYHTFYKIRCLSVVLRICKSFAIILGHLSLLCLCGKWNLMYCNTLVARVSLLERVICFPCLSEYRHQPIPALHIPCTAWNITFISMICHFRCCPCLFLHNTCWTSDVSAGGWPRTWAGICKCWGRNY